MDRSTCEMTQSLTQNVHLHNCIFNTNINVFLIKKKEKKRKENERILF